MDKNYAKKKALYEKIMAPVAKTLMKTLNEKGIKEEIEALPNVDDMPIDDEPLEYDDEIPEPDMDDEVDDIEDEEEDDEESDSKPSRSSSKKASSSVTIKFDGDFEDMLKTAEGKKIMAMLEPMEYEDLEEIALILNSKSARAQEREDFINALVTLSKYLYEKKRLDKVYESRASRYSRRRRLDENDDFAERRRHLRDEDDIDECGIDECDDIDECGNGECGIDECGSGDRFMNESRRRREHMRRMRLLEHRRQMLERRRRINESRRPRRR